MEQRPPVGCAGCHGNFKTSPHRARPARQSDQLQGLAAGSRAADADEQPRSRGGRAPGGPGGLRRHRTGRPKLGGVRRDCRDAAHPGERRDHAGAIGQAGRRFPHPRVVAPRADRQLESGWRLGELGEVPGARGGGADDVRPDDRRLVDLHRHPGHPAGHVRDVRCGGAKAFRGHPGRNHHPDRGPRRHGRRPTSGGHDERRRGDLRGLRPEPHRPAHRAALPRHPGRHDRRRFEARRRSARCQASVVDRTSGQRG